MKKEELVNIIRGIVREEVEKALPNVLVEILASKVSEDRLVIREEQQPTAPRRTPTNVPQKPKKFSSNPILNQVLNETQGGIPPDPDVQMVSADMPVPGQSVSILDKVKTIPKEQLAENKEVAGVLNVLKKDFRQIVRAIDKASPKAGIPNFKMQPGMFDDAK